MPSPPSPPDAVPTLRDPRRAYLGDAGQHRRYESGALVKALWVL